MVAARRLACLQALARFAWLQVLAAVALAQTLARFQNSSHAWPWATNFGFAVLYIDLDSLDCFATCASSLACSSSVVCRGQGFAVVCCIRSSKPSNGHAAMIPEFIFVGTLFGKRTVKSPLPSAMFFDGPEYWPLAGRLIIRCINRLMQQGQNNTGQGKSLPPPKGVGHHHSALPQRMNKPAIIS